MEMGSGLYGIVTFLSNTVHGKPFEGENFRGYKTKPPLAGKALRFTRSPIRATIDT